MNQNELQRIAVLMIKYLKNELPPDEWDELEIWYNKSAANRDIIHKFTDSRYLGKRLKEIRKIKVNKEWKKLSEAAGATSASSFNFWRNIAAAAVLILFACGVVVFAMIIRSRESGLVYTISGAKFNGTSNIILQLPGNKILGLDTLPDGLIPDANISIIKNANKIVYTPGKNELTNPESRELNTLSTFNKANYTVQLPDGSFAMLNAQSSITYPVQFPSNERRVIISGQVYFEIEHDSSRPFRVTIQRITRENIIKEVEVLGTHFDIKSYPNNHEIVTTLLEGQVKLHSISATKENSMLLKPGEAGIINTTGEISKRSANFSVVNGWRMGQFTFENEAIGNVIKDIARWYGFDVKVPDNIQKIISIEISRNNNVEETISTLRLLSGLDISINGNMIIVQE